jgi:hypothetical protein
MLNITGLGLTILAANYIPTIFMMRRVLRGNVPESLPAESYAKVVVAKVVFAMLLAMLAGSKPFGPAAPIVALAASLGPGYFIASMVIDLVSIIFLRLLEFYNSFKIVVFNLPYIPFITPLALCYGVFVEQGRTVKRVLEDLPVRDDGVLLGHAVKLIRRINKPVRVWDEADVRPHYDIRPIPKQVGIYYSPVIGERDFNPHAIIAGSSGSGKTTTLYHVVRELSKKYPVVLVDVKGDITRALLSEGVNAYIVPVADVGINPFSSMVEGEQERHAVERLINSISVYEEVGSRQAHFIREAYAEIYHSEKALTFTGLVEAVERREIESLKPESYWGPGTRDALFSISSKLKDLSEYLKDEGQSPAKILSEVIEGGGPTIAVFNLEGVGEKARAIILELILQMLSKYLHTRGPMAYLEKRPIVLMVDEAYLVTKPIERHGRRGEESRSILETIARAGRSYGVALILVTQRLSDIADGIRQNCQTWIVFNTTSPEDKRILGTLGEIISKVVSELDKGYAYIRVPNPRKIDSYRYTRETYAITEGYIFRMERKILKIEQSNEKKDKQIGVVCYRCMLLIKDTQHCPNCKNTPLLTPVKEDKQDQAKTSSEKPQASGNGRDVQKSINWEEVREMAIKKSPSITKFLAELELKNVEEFVTKYPEVDIERFIKLGLIKPPDPKKLNKIKPSPAGRVLLEAYKEVTGK